MKHLNSTSFARRLHAGFSLVEVTIAMGIAALALTTLLGLTPHGLTEIKKAGDLAAESRISEHILGTLTQARWQDGDGRDILNTKFDQRRYYFNDQGIPLDPGAESGPELSYVAEVRVPAKDVALPGVDPESQPAGGDPFLRKVTVKVTSVPRQDFDFEHALPLAFRSQTTLIARTGN